MKTMLAMAAATVTMMAGSAMAQEMVAKIPFGFEARSVKLDAGEYRVIRVAEHGGAKMYQMQNQETGRSIMMLANPAEKKGVNKPELTFECAGEGTSNCRLAGVWPGGPQGFTIGAPTKHAGDSKPSVRTVDLQLSR